MPQAITRYDVRYLGDFPWELAPFENGDFVKFEDHVAALSPLAALYTPDMHDLPDDQPLSWTSCRMLTVGDARKAAKMKGEG